MDIESCKDMPRKQSLRDKHKTIKKQILTKFSEYEETIFEEKLARLVHGCRC